MFPKRRNASVWMFVAIAFVVGMWLSLTSLVASPYDHNDAVGLGRDSVVVRLLERTASAVSVPSVAAAAVSANNILRSDLAMNAVNSSANRVLLADDTNNNAELHEHEAQPWDSNAGDASELNVGNLRINQSDALRQMRDNMTMKDFNASHVSDILELIAMNKDNRIVNPHPFKYIFSGENLCHNADIFLIVYVHTAPSHFKHRSIIRQTWGNQRFYKDSEVRVVFIMGLSDSAATQQAVAFESAQYGDIVQENFKDTYRNLTYKGIAALKWITTYCSNAKFVLKSDDDMFVNMFTLLRHLHSLAELSGTTKHLLLCLVWDRMPVLRQGKWGVSEKELKSDFYPVYCSGSAFVMTTDVAIAMYDVSYFVPFFWVDDFYVTGLLTMKIPDLDRRQFISTYELDGQKLEQKFNGPQWYAHVFSHLRIFGTYVDIWNKLVELAGGTAKHKVDFRLPEAEQQQQQPQQ